MKLNASIVLLAIGFLESPADSVLAIAGAEIDGRSSATSPPEVFACGDTRRGRSLVVWAIHEGRDYQRP